MFSAPDCDQNMPYCLQHLAHAPLARHPVLSAMFGRPASGLSNGLGSTTGTYRANCWRRASGTLAWKVWLPNNSGPNSWFVTAVDHAANSDASFHPLRC
jgi:hypothetical protein